MSSETFMEHIAYLSQLGQDDVALLYMMLLKRGPWPQVGGRGLDPLALIVFAVGELVQKLDPGAEPLAHIEVDAIAHGVGHLQFQMSTLQTIANVAIVPTMGSSESAQQLSEGAQQVARQIFEALAMFNGEEVPTEEEGNGETDEA
jgi:hypothetical protein